MIAAQTLILLSLFSIAETDPYPAKVIKIIDGDTVDVLTRDKQAIRLRFNEIDAPESGQPFGRNAKEWVSKTIGGKTVQVEVTDTDRYGRAIANIRYRGKLINERLVKEGLAWHYVQFAKDRKDRKDRKDLAEAEAYARRKKAGLWKGSQEPIAPWEWRRLSKDEQGKLK